MDSASAQVDPMDEEEDVQLPVSVSGSIVLEDGVPMPPPGPSGTARLYPWGRMATRQSFLVPADVKNPRALVVKAMTAHPGRQFEYRRVTEQVDGKPRRCVRFWRTA